MEQRALKNVNDCLNSNIYSYLETSGGKIYNLYLNVIHFLNTSLNYISVAAKDICFRALVYNKRCSIEKPLCLIRGLLGLETVCGCCDLLGTIIGAVRGCYLGCVEPLSVAEGTF